MNCIIILHYIYSFLSYQGNLLIFFLLQSLKSEVAEHAPQLEKLQSEGKSLASLVEQDKEIAKEAMQVVSEKWQSLDQGVTDRVRSLEDLMQKLDDFQYNMKDYSSNLTKCEDSLKNHNNIGPSAKDPKHADKIKVRVWSCFHNFLSSFIIITIIIIIKFKSTIISMIDRSTIISMIVDEDR